jgi:hypothetical protein
VVPRNSVSVDVRWWSFLKLIDLVLRKPDLKASKREEIRGWETVEELRTGHLVEKLRLCWSWASEEVDKVSEETDSFASEETRKGEEEMKREAKGGGRRKNPPPRAAVGGSPSIRREKGRTEPCVP